MQQPNPIDSAAMAESAHRVDHLSEVERWVHERVREQRLGKQALRVIRTIAGSPRFAATATVAQFAQRVGVDPATVVRGAKSLGCTGWSELQGELRLLVAPTGGGSDGTSRHVVESNFDSALKSDARAVTELRESLSEVDCRRFVQSLVGRTGGDEGRRPRLYLYGSGSQLGPLTQLAHVSARLGLTAEPVGWAGRSPHTAFSGAEAGDSFLILSIWRTPAETEVMAQVARSRGLRVHVITDTSFSQLTPYADDMLVISTDGESHFPSMVALSSLVHVLLVLITEELGEAGAASIRAHDEIFFAVEEARAGRGAGKA